MAGWKSLKRASGTGAWKELDRVAGTGAWKELLWDIPTYEDLTTFTEVDPNSRITVTSPRASGRHYRNEDAYVYKDFGIDHFNALNIQFECQITDAGSISAIGPMFGLANAVDDVKNLSSTDLWVAMDNFVSASKYFRLVRGGNYVAHDSWTGGSAETQYYCWLKRTAGNNTVTLEIRTGSHTGTLQDTLSVSGYGTTKWRYLYAFNTYYSNSSLWTDGYTENVKLL